MNTEDSMRVASSVRTEMLRLHGVIEKFELAIARLAQEKAELKEQVKFWKDTDRLQWMQFHGARVEWGNDCELCSVSWLGDDGERRTKLFDDWRAAIDAARAKEGR